MKARQAHRMGTFVLSAAMVLIGIALIVQAAAGEGSAVVHVLLGALFLAAGGARSYLELRRSRGA